MPSSGPCPRGGGVTHWGGAVTHGRGVTWHRGGGVTQHAQGVTQHGGRVTQHAEGLNQHMGGVTQHAEGVTQHMGGGHPACRGGHPACRALTQAQAGEAAQRQSPGGEPALPSLLIERPPRVPATFPSLRSQPRTLSPCPSAGLSQACRTEGTGVVVGSLGAPPAQARMRSALPSTPALSSLGNSSPLSRAPCTCPASPGAARCPPPRHWCFF